MLKRRLIYDRMVCAHNLGASTSDSAGPKMSQLMDQLRSELEGRLITALSQLLRDVDAASQSGLTIAQIGALRTVLFPRRGRPPTRIRCPRCGRFLKGLIPEGSMYTRPNSLGRSKTASFDLIPWHNDALTERRPTGPRRGKDRKRKCLASYQPFEWVKWMQSLTNRGGS